MLIADNYKDSVRSGDGIAFLHSPDVHASATPCNPSSHMACVHKAELINFDTRTVPACNGSWIHFGEDRERDWQQFLSLLPALEYEVHGVRFDRDDNNYVQVPLGEAERFGLYRVVKAGEFRELRHMKDFTTAEYAFRAKTRRESPIEEGQIYCLCHEDRCTVPQRELVFLSCSGGAIGDLYLCPEKYLEHIKNGGDDGDICGICC